MARKKKALIERIHECKNRIKEVDKTFRDELYVELAEIGIISWELTTNKGEWTTFRKDAFWRKRKLPEFPSLEVAARCVCRLVWGAGKSGTARYNRCWKYGRALSEIVDGNATAEDIAARLKAGKIEGLLGFVADERDKPEVTDANEEKPELHIGDDADDDNDDDDFGDDDGDGDTAETDQSGKTKTASEEDFDDLSVKVRNEAWPVIGGMRKGDRALIEVQCYGRSADGFVHLAAVEVSAA